MWKIPGKLKRKWVEKSKENPGSSREENKRMKKRRSRGKMERKRKISWPEGKGMVDGGGRIQKAEADRR